MTWRGCRNHDWPIEEKNGVLGPIPIEEYLARKFSSADDRMKSLEEKVDFLDKKVRILEQESRRRAVSVSAEKE